MKSARLTSGRGVKGLLPKEGMEWEKIGLLFRDGLRHRAIKRQHEGVRKV